LNPVTVFVPDDKAFSTMNAAMLDTLEKPANRQALANLLLYHIINGKITAKDILRQIHANNGQAILTTLSGHKLVATINTARNIVLTDENGGQSIISKFDIRQKNGLMDMITAVLMPKSGQ